MKVSVVEMKVKAGSPNYRPLIEAVEKLLKAGKTDSVSHVTRAALIMAASDPAAFRDVIAKLPNPKTARGGTSRRTRVSNVGY